MLKKILLLTAALLITALFLVVPAWPGTLPASIIPDGTAWVAHLDMEKFVATKLYEVLEKEGHLQVRSHKISRMMKIDLFKDITGLTIFGLGPGEKRVVFAAAGRFNKERLLSFLDLDEDHREIPYAGKTIYSTDENGYGVFINDGLIVFAERRDDIERVLDTAADKAKNFVSSKLYAAFKDISAGAFVSGIINDLAGLGHEIRQSKLIEKASGLFFTARERQDNFELRLQVSAASPERAKDMADIAQGIIAMARLGQGKEGPRAERIISLLQGLRIKLEGKTVGLEFDVPSRELIELISYSHDHGFGEFLD